MDLGYYNGPISAKLAPEQRSELWNAKQVEDRIRNQTQLFLRLATALEELAQSAEVKSYLGTTVYSVVLQRFQNLANRVLAVWKAEHRFIRGLDRLDIQIVISLNGYQDAVTFNLQGKDVVSLQNGTCLLPVFDIDKPLGVSMSDQMVAFEHYLKSKGYQ